MSEYTTVAVGEAQFIIFVESVCIASRFDVVIASVEDRPQLAGLSEVLGVVGMAVLDGPRLAQQELVESEHIQQRDATRRRAEQVRALNQSAYEQGSRRLESPDVLTLSARALDIQQQMFAFPGGDDALVGVEFGVLDRRHRSHEGLAENALEPARAGEAVERVVERARQGVGEAVAAALDGLGGLQVLHHAQVAARQRGRDGEIGVGIRPGAAVFHPPRLAAGDGHAEADGAVVAERATVDFAPTEPGPVAKYAPVVLTTLVLALAGPWLSRRRPKLLENVGTAASEYSLVSHTVGGLLSVTFLSVFVFMAFTLVLIPVSLLGLFVGAVTIAYGVVSLGYLVGSRLGTPRTGLATAVGVVAVVALLQVLGAVTFVGDIVAAAILVTGLGAVVLTYFGLQRFEPALPGYE